MLRVNKIMKCYLTQEAEDALRELIRLGMDPDLALACLEAQRGAETLYEVSEEAFSPLLEGEEDEVESGGTDGAIG